MVSTTKYQNELIFLMFHFGNLQLRTFLLQQVRINKTGFVSEMFIAFYKMLWVMSSGYFLEQIRLAWGNAIPKLRFACMQIIYSRQVEILLMPREERFPTPDVNIRCVHAFAFVSHRIFDQRLQIIHVP